MARRCAASLPLVALLGQLLAGCGSQPPQWASQPGYWGEQHNSGNYRVGRPYKINGVWYFPAVDYDYDRTGVASWYGEQFEGRLTANGEIFDLNELTAAHTTLPMPSIVQVSNLQNGRSLQLRVNDRGPFVDGRLIDVSRRAAQLLGFEGQGTTLVRVKVLKAESIAAAEDAMRGSARVVVADAGAAAAASPPISTAMPYAAPPVMARSPAALAAPPPPKPSAPLPAQPAAPAAIAALAPPRAAAAAAAPPASTPVPSLQTMALASPPAPPARHATHSPFSRFALIAPAEAAEMPVPRSVAPRPAPEKPNSSAKFADAAAGRIYVQAGAFSLPDNARRVQQHLARWGSAQVTTVSVHGAELYRVRLGPFQSAAQAHGLVSRLIESGFREARIVGD